MVPTTIYSERIDTLPTELSDLVRAKIGAIASLSGVDIVPRLPKTRSRKILRRTLRQIVDGQTSDTPSTIENPTVAGDRQSPPPQHRSRGADATTPSAPRSRTGGDQDDISARQSLRSRRARPTLRRFAASSGRSIPPTTQQNRQ
ncbi:AMP-binding enzyme [Rhodococcus opacus]|uniref:AMP-binding enzyme n=1 Tax=Rhodococcus opacus TaxID=37919 RepID=UPI001F53E52D|nr:hypothetical protein [Rhodococcus opacus]